MAHIPPPSLRAAPVTAESRLLGGDGCVSPRGPTFGWPFGGRTCPCYDPASSLNRALDHGGDGTGHRGHWHTRAPGPSLPAPLGAPQPAPQVTVPWLVWLSGERLGPRLRGPGFISNHGHLPWLQAQPLALVRGHSGQPIDVSPSSLPPSLPSVSRRKHALG